MKCKLITAPTIEPVDLASLKLHLCIDSGSFSENIDETISIAPGSYGVDYELMTLDVAPGGAGWAIGNTITGITSIKTCIIVTIITTLTYIVKSRSGAFTLGEVLTNGTDTADQGAANPTFATGYRILGTAVEVLGYEATVVLNAGECTATGILDVKIQESDNGTTWTDWTGGAFTQVTAANDLATQEKAYTGTKRYIRTVAQVTTDSCQFGTTIIRLNPQAAEDDLLNDSIETSREHVEDITRRAILTQTWDYYLDEFPSDNYIRLPFGNLQNVTRITYKESDWDGTDEPVSSLAISDSDCVESDGTYALIFTGSCTTAATGTYTIASNVITAVTLTAGGAGYSAAPTVATQTGDGAITAEIGQGLLMLQNTDYLVETNGDQCGRIVLPYAETWPSSTLYPSNPIIIRFVAGWTAASFVPAKIRTAIKMLCAKEYENRGEDTIKSSGQVISEDKFYSRLLASVRLHDEF